MNHVICMCPHYIHPLLLGWTAFLVVLYGLPFSDNSVEQFCWWCLHLSGSTPQSEGMAIPHLAVQNFHLRVTAIHAHPSPGPIRHKHNSLNNRLYPKLENTFVHKHCSHNEINNWVTWHVALTHTTVPLPPVTYFSLASLRSEVMQAFM